MPKSKAAARTTITKKKAAPPKKPTSAKKAPKLVAPPEKVVVIKRAGGTKKVAVSTRASVPRPLAPTPVRRQVVRYLDNDGISLLVDRAAIQARYGAKGARFDTNLETDLLPAINRHELIAFGTHQGGDAMAVVATSAFAPPELRSNGIKSTVEAGLLKTSGAVVVCDWAHYSLACSAHRGDLSKGGPPAKTLQVPAGTYRVRVHRSIGADPDADDVTRLLLSLIELSPAPEGTMVEPLTEIPGADGVF